MTAAELIEKINNSSSFKSVFPELGKWNDTYIEYIKMIHPDVCTVHGAHEANIKLNLYKEQLENGVKFRDDAGGVRYTPKEIVFEGDKKFLELSSHNYMTLWSKKDKDSTFFKKYIPESHKGNYIYELFDRAIPLLHVSDYFQGNVPQEHVNWIVNRILEFCCWMAQSRLVHCGLTPESIFVIPESHGIVVSSFYHMTTEGKRIMSVSGKYQSFYPSYLFDKKHGTKEATSKVDLECTMKIALYLLGDKTGNGAKLRKTHNNELLNFYSQVHEVAHTTYEQHKAIVAKHFPKKFYSLEL